MISSKTACEIARALPDVTEKDHFGGDAFSANKRIFATVWHDQKQVNVRLTPTQQREFLEKDGEAFAEIDNAWGRQGWTKVHLEFIERDLFEEALKAAYDASAVKSTRAASTKKKAPTKSAAKKSAAKKAVKKASRKTSPKKR